MASRCHWVTKCRVATLALCVVVLMSGHNAEGAAEAVKTPALPKAASELGEAKKVGKDVSNLIRKMVRQESESVAPASCQTQQQTIDQLRTEIARLKATKEKPSGNTKRDHIPRE